VNYARPEFRNIGDSLVHPLSLGQANRRILSPHREIAAWPWPTASLRRRWPAFPRAALSLLTFKFRVDALGWWVTHEVKQVLRVIKRLIFLRRASVKSGTNPSRRLDDSRPPDEESQPGGREQRNDFATLPTIDSKVRIRCPNDCPRAKLAHSDEAGVGE